MHWMSCTIRSSNSHNNPQLDELHRRYVCEFRWTRAFEGVPARNGCHKPAWGSQQQDETMNKRNVNSREHAPHLVFFIFTRHSNAPCSYIGYRPIGCSHHSLTKLLCIGAAMQWHISQHQLNTTAGSAPKGFSGPSKLTNLS